MFKLRTILLSTLLVMAFGTAGAQTLKMDGMSADAGDARPSRGMSQASVQSRYGSPTAVKAPVGNPPITRWEYQDFVVYFEYDKVIHAVTKR
ncbi:MAG: hypothetical protein KJO46_09275 [Gammaproteobacteria bacterium]|nr:hypothetical protein [Gammaproteobacteria bacterium]